MGVLFTGGLLALGAGVAHAAENQAGTDGSGSVLGGTQAVAPLHTPITVGGNSVAILGDAGSSGSASAPASGSGSTGAGTSGDDAVLGGTQVVAPVDAPVTVGGNAIALLGDSGTSGSASAPASGPGSTGAGTSGSEGIGSGSQVVAPVSVPLTVGGNSIGLLGDSGTSGSASAPASGSGSTGAGTSGDDAVLGGTQVVAPVDAPVTVGGNAIALLGDSAVAATDDPTASGAAGSTGSDAGEQAAPRARILTLVRVPVTLRDDAIGVLGDAVVSGSDQAAVDDPATGTDPVASGGDGSVGGSEIDASVDGTSVSPAALSVRTLATTGSDPWGILIIGFALVLLGGGLGLRGLVRG